MHLCSLIRINWGYACKAMGTAQPKTLSVRVARRVHDLDPPSGACAGEPPEPAHKPSHKPARSPLSRQDPAHLRGRRDPHRPPSRDPALAAKRL
jgi:hypothetical protein